MNTNFDDKMIYILNSNNVEEEIKKLSYEELSKLIKSDEFVGLSLKELCIDKK